jgi:hypothetical protein
MTKALKHEFHIFDLYIVDKLFEKIQVFLPIQKHGTNLHDSILKLHNETLMLGH